MTKLPFPKNSFDLLWAEGSAYVIGIENALAQWRSVLKKHGYLMLSDMVWRTSTPSCESIEFWEQEYPDIQLVQTRINQMKKAGYQVIDHFPQSESAWLNVSDLKSALYAVLGTFQGNNASNFSTVVASAILSSTYLM